jgi:hypothetical protein
VSEELTLSIKALYEKSGTEVTFPDLAAQEIGVTISGTRLLHSRQLIGTSEEALELGDIATGGYFIAVNRDATNFVDLRSGTEAIDLVRLNAGEVCAFRISPDATAPFAIADTAAVDLEFLLLEA